MTYLDEFQAYRSLFTALKLITHVVFDVDGVLTDGRLHYGEKGEALKVFNVKDGVGIKLLNDFGIKTIVITAKDSSMVASRMADLGVSQYSPGTQDKSALLAKITEEQGLSPESLCNVGDDMVDLAAMRLCSVSLCPKDAYGLVVDYVDAVLKANAGEGVAREVCDLILVAQEQFEAAYKLAETPAFERTRKLAKND